MTRHDLAVIAKSAALSMLLTLPVLLPAAVSAGPEKIVQLGLAEHAPTLKVGGAELTVALGKPHYAAGEAIVMVATATNPTDAPVHIAATVQLVRVPYSSPMSRMRAMPTSTHEAPVVLDLKPGETRVVRLKTHVKMGNGDSAQILASAKGQEHQVILAAAGIGERPKDPMGLGNVELIPVAPIAPDAQDMPVAEPEVPTAPAEPTSADAEVPTAPAVAAVEK
ncbi:MAG: hypothetical protein EP329_23665 [Deltaproteobacteria bacterium]|nr:MAG: hypothetical protein EP329_23665 [Deltaproteobacteria bacterium]